MPSRFIRPTLDPYWVQKQNQCRRCQHNAEVVLERAYSTLAEVDGQAQVSRRCGVANVKGWPEK